MYESDIRCKIGSGKYSDYGLDCTTDELGNMDRIAECFFVLLISGG